MKPRKKNQRGSLGVRLLDVRRNMLNAARSRAQAKNLPFNLTLDDLVIPDVCPALGIPLEVGHSQPTDASPSLDKVIPALGYVRGNIIVVSNRANRAKNNLTIHELTQLAAFYEGLVSGGAWMSQHKEPEDDG